MKRLIVFLSLIICHTYIGMAGTIRFPFIKHQELKDSLEAYISSLIRKQKKIDNCAVWIFVEEKKSDEVFIGVTGRFEFENPDEKGYVYESEGVSIVISTWGRLKVLDRIIDSCGLKEYNNKEFNSENFIRSGHSWLLKDSILFEVYNRKTAHKYNMILEGKQARIYSDQTLDGLRPYYVFRRYNVFEYSPNINETFLGNWYVKDGNIYLFYTCGINFEHGEIEIKKMPPSIISINQI